ncbi:MAG: DMT family transporter [Alphaproteobacteria bacterium]
MKTQNQGAGNISRADLWQGTIAAIVMIATWAGFVVFARLGSFQGLTPYDLGLLRFGVSATVAAPFAYIWWPRHLTVLQIIVLAVVGPGVVYGLLSYQGLSLAPAAYAGVFTNGTMPVITAIYVWIFLGDRFGPRALTGIALVTSGCIMLGLFDVEPLAGTKSTDVRFGALLLLLAGAVLSAYVVLARHWRLAPKQALVVIALPNFGLMLPIWLFSGPSGIPTADFTTVLFQALFQGLGPATLAVFCYATIIDKLGSATTAACSAVVPAVAAIFAIPILGEWPSLIQWCGIFAVSVGLAVFFTRRGL